MNVETLCAGIRAIIKMTSIRQKMSADDNAFPRRKSGRPSRFGEPTRTVRLPVSMIPAIKAFLRGQEPLSLFDQTVPAGFPSPAENYEHEGLNIVSYLIPHPENAFLLRLADDRLNRYALFDGDLLVIRRDLTPTQADLVVLELDGEIALLPFSDPKARTAAIRGVVRYAIREPLA